MNTQSPNQFFFLQADTDRDIHDIACCCGEPQPLPHRAIGASLYKLDVLGLQALNDFLMGDDEDSFDEWLGEQESQGTYYGPTEDVAIAEAIQQACKDGMLVINYPEHFPWVLPLASALRGVVGYGGFVSSGCLPKDVCECDSTHIREQTVCRACYARLVCNIISTFIYNHLRRCDS